MSNGVNLIYRYVNRHSYYADGLYFVDYNGCRYEGHSLSALIDHIILDRL